jgi:hypothetical protein
VNIKNKILSIKYYFIGYVLSVIGLFLYSFTQVDLSLTLSRASIYQYIEKGFQYIGFFNRPLSSLFYILILLFLFIFYALILIKINKDKISRKTLWVIILITTGILTFSYNAFSYDLFNYIFDAKIFTHYGLNPYSFMALDFPKDPMLSFMHWTHRTYPYGPIWLGLTIPVSFLGLNYFLPTFFLFKILVSASFIGTVFYIEKILNSVAPKKALFNIAFFALNPLLLIEVLVSSHNDMPMMFFAILAIYLAIKHRWLLGFFVLVLSALTKQVTVFLIVPYVLFWGMTFLRKKFSEAILIKSFVLFIILGFIYVLTKIEVQPWYFLWIFTLVSLLNLNKFIILFVNGIIVGLLLRYLPFIYYGNWDGIVINLKLYVTLIAPALSLVALGLLSLPGKVKR